MKRAVVIGAGPAGIACAATLSRSSQRRVLLLDAGSGADANALRWPLLGDNSRMFYEGGSGLGGGALVNGRLLGPDDGPIENVASRSTPYGSLGAALAAALATTRPVRLLDPEPGASIATALGLDADVRARIDLRAGVTAYRVLFDRRRVTGVATDRGTFVADEVFVAAGAIRTPLLLLDSGVRAPGLGEGLHDHPALTISVPLHDAGDRPTSPPVNVSAVAAIGEPIASGGNSQADAAGMLYALERFGAPPGPSRLGLQIALLNSQRSGRVSRHQWTGKPVVDLGAPVDAQRLVELWSHLVPILQTADVGALLADATIDQWGTGWRDVEPPRDAGVDANGALPRAVGGLYHAAGTCAAAAESDGAVSGYRGLFVADISRLERSPVWPMRSSIDCGRASAVAAIETG